jgi:hypothetical protein
MKNTNFYIFLKDIEESDFPKETIAGIRQSMREQEFISDDFLLSLAFTEITLSYYPPVVEAISDLIFSKTPFLSKLNKRR